MTFARIADIELTEFGELEFGSVQDGAGRTVSIQAQINDTTQDAVNALVSRLNSRLAAPCDLVLQPTGSSYPQALQLRGGVAKVIDHVRHDLAPSALLHITAPCAPYATPANRVYLAAPIGDEWPDSDDVVRTTNDSATYPERYVYADGGRWVVRADASRTGQLQLYGDCTAGEVLSFDTVCDVRELSATDWRAYVVWKTAAGATVGSDLPLVYIAGSAARSRQTHLLTVPATAARFVVVFAHPIPTGDCLAYIESVEVGRLASAAGVTTPLCIQTPAYSWGYTYPENEYTRNTPSGCVWGYATRYLTATCTAVADAVTLYSTGIVACQPGDTVGLHALSSMAVYTTGTARLMIYWYDADGSVIDATAARTVTAADGAPVTTVYAAEAPDRAASARAVMTISSGSTMTFRVSSLYLSTGIVETPAAIPLRGMLGEHPAPLEVIGDVDPESDAHLVYLGVGDGASPHVWEAEDLTWSGGTTAYSTATALYPGAGNTGRQNTGTSRAAASIDTQRVKPGAYLLLVRAKVNNVAYTGTLDCVENGEEVETGSTTPEWLSLGQITLPIRKTLPGTASNFTVGMVTDDASGVVTVDRYALIPLSLGGSAWYHPTTDPTNDISRLDVDAGGSMLIDGLVNLSYCTTGRLLATSRDRLVVCAEKVASAEATHLVSLAALHRPLYDLWRGE